MASSNCDEKVLMEAATDTDIPDARDEDGCWTALKMYLKCNKVDINTRKPAEWMKALDRYRRALRKNEKAVLAGRSSSTESERRSDVGSLTDSGYDSGSPRDQNDQLDLRPQDIYAFAMPFEEGGKEPLCCCYSDKIDEDYIIETVRERLNLNERDKDGKVTVRWVPQGGGKTSKTRCAVWPDKEGEADMVFTTKVTEKVESGSKEEQLEEQGSRDTSRSREASRRLQQQISQPDRLVAETLACFLEKSSVKERSDDEVTELGRLLQLLAQGASADSR